MAEKNWTVWHDKNPIQVTNYSVTTECGSDDFIIIKSSKVNVFKILDFTSQKVITSALVLLLYL